MLMSLRRRGPLKIAGSNMKLGACAVRFTGTRHDGGKMDDVWAGLNGEPLRSVLLAPMGAETQDCLIDGWVKVVTAFGPESCKRLVGAKGPYLASLDASPDEVVARVIIVPHDMSFLSAA